MSRNSDASDRNRNESDDQERNRRVYRYLLTLTDLDLLGKGTTPNESHIAKQWGVEENRIFVRRVLRSVLFKEFYAKKENKPTPVPGLTLSKLIGILSALQDHRKEQQSLDDESQKASRVVTRAEKLKALQLFAQLSPKERSRLNLKTPPEKALLDLILERATDQTEAYKGYTADDVMRLYRFFLQQLSERSSRSLADIFADTNASSATSWLEDLIKKVVSKYTDQYSQGLTHPEKEKRDSIFVKKVRREIDRIELQSGAEQADTFLTGTSRGSRYKGLPQHITIEFIQRLTHSVIDNELLTDEFPIHIKFFEIERVKPLPLYIKDKSDPEGLLNPSLQDDKAPHSVEGLARQVAYRVRVHFYIRPPDDYKIKFDKLTIFKKTAGQNRLEFSEEVVGVGCPTSHIIAVINRVLLWDIPVLKEYLPIADGIHCNDEIVGGTPNSPVWSHCVARLYKRKDIYDAIDSGKSCADVVTTAEVASADFCGFDLLETMSKAALLARLSLVKQTLANQPNVTVDQYVRELCIRVEEMTALKRAQSLLTTYPFSLRAMEGQLEATIFKRKYRKRLPGPVFKVLADKWSVVALEAQLSIAEANLKEGLLHVAKRYLETMPTSFHDKDEPAADLLMARYCLCMFRYYYLSDLEDPSCEFPDRHLAVRKAEEELEKAEKCLQRRLQHYEKLDELTQSNLNPQFYFLSRIYAHRAKLYIFFPDYMHKLDQWDILVEPIKLLEKARIYAARDGAPALYAQWSAYQAWCYIMLAYLGKQEGNKNKEFSHNTCIDWAERLIEHAEVCFSSTGKRCYQEIKDGGGRTTPHGYDLKASAQSVKSASEQEEAALFKDSPVTDVDLTRFYEKYGSTMIQVIPLIQELFQNDGQKNNQSYQSDRNVVEVELALLKTTGNDEGSDVYLFGMQSSMLLFAKGMLSLCKPYEDDQALIDAVDQKAMRMFQYCCAIASDGTQRIEDPTLWPEGAEADSIVINRVLPKLTLDDDSHSKDRLLQCFYPHRLTQFADLGKIFIIVCRLLLVARGELIDDDDIERVRSLVAELRENNSFPFSKDKTCGQKRYNGQLAEHYVRIERYTDTFIDMLQKKQLKKTSSLQLRDQLVADIFEIIRGEVNILPRT